MTVHARAALRGQWYGPPYKGPPYIKSSLQSQVPGDALCVNECTALALRDWRNRGTAVAKEALDKGWDIRVHKPSLPQWYERSTEMSINSPGF